MPLSGPRTNSGAETAWIGLCQWCRSRSPSRSRNGPAVRLGRRDEFGKVPGHRPFVAAAQLHLIALAEADRSEPVPLRLVGRSGWDRPQPVWPASAKPAASRAAAPAHSRVSAPMTLPGFEGLREYGNRGPTRHATAGADAGQGPGQGSARSGGVVLRAEMGRLPRAGVPRRRRGRPAVAQRQGSGPVLPGTGRGAARRAGAALRARRRGRRAAGDRRPHPAGLGVAVAAHPSGRQPDQDAGRADARALHRLRRAGHRRHVAFERAVPGPSASACPRR